MDTEIIIPDKKEKNKNKNLLTPIIYLIVGVILAFKSNEAVKLVIYVIGILIIIYGLKSLVTYFKTKDVVPYKNLSLSVAIASFIIGALILLLSGALETSIRFVIGFFLLYMGISRFLMQISYGTLKSFATLSNIILIGLGIYSIFFSNAILVIVGWFLIVNAFLLIWEYIRN